MDFLAMHPLSPAFHIFDFTTFRVCYRTSLLRLHPEQNFVGYEINIKAEFVLKVEKALFREVLLSC